MGEDESATLLCQGEQFVWNGSLNDIDSTGNSHKKSILNILAEHCARQSKRYNVTGCNHTTL